jgi:hypothetical protein
MDENEFNALYPLDPLGTVEAQLNEHVELGILTRRWSQDRGCCVYRAREGEALDEER